MLAIALVVMLGQCSKDTDCKGDRICVDGQCVGARLVPDKPERPLVRDPSIGVLERQRPSLYAPISTLVLGAILEVAGTLLLPITGDFRLPAAAWVVGLGALISGGISLGTTLWARSQVGQMMEEREQRR